MRFKDYIWPHNPRVYEIAFQRVMAVQKIPQGLYRLQNLGATRRVLRGEGEFCGKNAYEEFKKLASIFYEETPGLLVHPLWQPAQAYFVSLKLQQSPMPEYVQYSFEFWEEAEDAARSAIGEQQSESRLQEGKVYHTVVQGETLWQLAQRYQVGLEALLAQNPQIKNPNLLQAGEKVRVQ